MILDPNIPVAFLFIVVLLLLFLLRLILDDLDDLPERKKDIAIQLINNSIISKAVVRSRNVHEARITVDLKPNSSATELQDSAEARTNSLSDISNGVLFGIALIVLMIVLLSEALLDKQSLEIAYSVIAICISIYLFFLTLYKMRRTFSALEILLFFTSLQLLLVPAFFYSQFSSYSNMAVTQTEYFQVVLLGFLCLMAGIHFPFLEAGQIQIPQHPSINKGVFLIIVGFLSVLLVSSVPIALRHVFHVFGFFVYIGALYVYFSPSGLIRWLFILPVVVFTIFSVSNEGMFKLLIYWLMTFGILWSIKVRLRYAILLLCALIFICMLVGIHATKRDYRQATWSDEGLQKERDITLLGSLLYEQASNPKLLLSQYSITSFLSRINQGEIVSRTISHVPRYEPYAKGDTIWAAIGGAFIPRVVWPDKPVAGGGEIYPRFTGSKLIGNTSANISPMGEAYVNFGREGGGLTLLLFGVFCAGYVRFLFAFCKRHICFIFWVPILLEPIVLNATEFASIFNSILKNTVLFFAVIYLFRKIFKADIV